MRRSEEHTSELQSRLHLVCRLLLEKKKSHSMADPAHGHYRTKAEVDEAKKRDPLLLLRTRMLGERLATEADFKRIEQEVAQIVREAVEFADASPAPSLASLDEDVYVP